MKQSSLFSSFSSRSLALVAFAALLGGLSLQVGCAAHQAPPKVESGRLYSTGNARYDAYFRDVHEFQIAASRWDGERRAIRKPIIASLELHPDAQDAAITQAAATRVPELKKNGNKLDAIDVAIESEKDRAKRLRATLPRNEYLAHVGEELKPTIGADFASQGEKQKKEVAREMDASLRALSSLHDKAVWMARSADAFAGDLKRFGADEAEAVRPPPVESQSKARKVESRTKKPRREVFVP